MWLPISHPNYSSNRSAMFWTVFILLLLFLIMWILFAPIYLSLYWDERHQQAQLRWFGLFRVEVFPAAEQWQVQLQLGFFKKRWSLWQLIQPSSKTKKDKPDARKKKKKNRRLKHPLMMVRRLLGSFHFTRFRLHVDTGDPIWNARLFPLFHLLKSSKKGDWAINFEGHTDVCIVVENRVARLLRAFFLTK